MPKEKKVGMMTKGVVTTSEKSDYVPFKSLVLSEMHDRLSVDKEGIEELAQNIKQTGLLNPLTVHKVKDKYEIIAGRRRYLALRLLSPEKVSVTIVEGKAVDLALVKYAENKMRENLTDVEEARMLTHMKKVGKLTDDQLAKQTGMSKSYIRQKLEIEKYPPQMVEALQKKEVTFSVCRELMRLKNPAMIKEYLRHAIRGGVTPALAKEWVDDIVRSEKAEKAGRGSGAKVKAGPSQPEPIYSCIACGGNATVNDSGLHRIHHKCFQELTSGG